MYVPDCVQLPASTGAVLFMVPAIRPPLLPRLPVAVQLMLLIAIVSLPETRSPPASAVNVAVFPSSIWMLAVTDTGFSFAEIFGTVPGSALEKVMEVVLMVSVAEQVLLALTSVMTMPELAFRGRGSPRDRKAIASMDKAMRDRLFF